MESGDSFGRYLIREKIGEGGMGEVYLADDTRLSRQVALKVLARAVAGDDERLRRFEQEARAASALNHPNILTVHEFGEENGLAFLACELVEGRTLRELISLRELDLRSGLKIAEQTAFALDTAHAAGIIHRDIKPENIMIRKDGFVKILDFGLAKLVEQVEARSEDETRAHFKTQAGHIVGTATYMSPEQARGLADIDARTDVWSLGILIHEMFAGRPPFTGDTISDVIASVLKTDAPPLAHLVDDCPPELDRIVTKSLRKDRQERYQVIKDLALDIRSLRKQMEFSAEYGRSIGGTPGMLTSEHASAKTTGIVAPRRPWLLAGAAILFLTAVILGAWFGLPKYGVGTPANQPALRSVEVVSWASQPGEIYSSGSFSPDGKMIAFASTKSGTKQLWVKQASSGEAVQVTSGEFTAGNPIWSPNGDELAFFSNRGEEPGFWRIPILGGSPRLLAKLENGDGVLRHWSQKGLVYFESNFAIYRINVDDGKAEKLIAPGEGDSATAGPIDISPDELRLAYVSVEGTNRVLFTREINETSASKLFSSAEMIRDVIWHQDSQRILFSSPVNGVFQVFVTDISGAAPRQITFSERDSFALDVSSDGSRIMLGSAKEESDIWSIGIGDNGETSLASEIEAELWPSISPDGKAIAYQSISNLSQGNNLFTGKIFLRKLQGKEPSVLIAEDSFLPTFSPDGQKLAFVRVTGDKFQIMTTKAAGGAQATIVAESMVPPSYSLLPYLRNQPNEYSWSPDSTRIAYASSRAGKRNIWIANIDGSPEVELSQNTDAQLYFSSPVWSHDGKQIAFTSKTGSSGNSAEFAAWIIDSESRVVRQLLARPDSIRILGWANDDRSLIIATTKLQDTGSLHSEVTISTLDLATAKAREIKSLEHVYLRNTFLSPDKKSIVFSAHRDGKDNLWIVPASGGAEKKFTDNNDGRLYFSTLTFSPDSGVIYFGKQSRYSLLSMITNFK